MATVRQKRLAKAIVENATAKKPKNKKTIIMEAGYPQSSAEATPTRIMEQQGVKDELEVLGFDVHAAKVTVAAILTTAEKDRDRLTAADMIFKVHGAYKEPVLPPTGNTFNFFFNPSVRTATNAYEEELKRLISHEPTQTDPDTATS